MRKPYWVREDLVLDQIKAAAAEKPYVVAVWFGTDSMVSVEHRSPDLVLGADRIPSDDDLVAVAVENLAPSAFARVMTSPRLEGVCMRYAHARKVTPLLEERGPEDVGWHSVETDDDLFVAWRAELVDAVCQIEPGNRERLWTTMFEAFEKMPGRGS